MKERLEGNRDLKEAQLTSKTLESVLVRQAGKLDMGEIFARFPDSVALIEHDR